MCMRGYTDFADDQFGDYRGLRFCATASVVALFIFLHIKGEKTMERRFLGILLAILMISSVFALSSCEWLFPVDPPTNENEESYREIYQLYVEYAESNGEVPDSYEDWLNSIRGEDGKDGKDGQDGKDGKDGNDGKDGLTPNIGYNGNWWIGNIDTGVPALPQNGVDGKDGEDGLPGKDGVDGTNGKDGVTPLLQITDGYWEVSYDNGESWIALGKAAGPKGETGNNGENGKDGITPKLRINETTYYWEVSYDSGETWESLGIKAAEDFAPSCNHVYEELYTIVNDCTGHKVMEYCTVCGNTHVSTRITNHNEGDWMVDIEPTCNKAGSKHTECTVCGTVINTETLEPTPHNTTIHAAKAPTCTEFGWSAYETCSECDYTTYKSIEKLGHTIYEVPEVKATCEENGNIHYWACESCGTCFEDESLINEIESSDTITPATGHTIIVDAAVPPDYDKTGLTEGEHCDVCGKVLLAQHVIPELKDSYHSIQYKNLKTADYPEITNYPEHKGLSDLPKVQADGYTFIGWYDSSIGGNVIDYIPAESTQDYILFARWELIEYTITFEDAPIHSNPTTYTVEDSFILTDASWEGLRFDNWTDENGDVITSIQSGTIGNKIITANWISEENYAIQSTNRHPIDVIFIPEQNRYYFIYDVGTIYNVVLGVIESQDKKLGESITFSKSNTITIENDIADTVAKTTLNSVTKTQEWNNTTTWATTKSKSSTAKLSASLEVEELGVKAKVEASVSTTKNITIGNERGYGYSNGNTFVGTNEYSVSSTVSYSKGTSTTLSTSATLGESMPAGRYKYVCTGTVIVCAVVTYDVDTGNYYVDTFSILEDDLSEKRLYESLPDVNDTNIRTSDALAFDIPTYDIEDYVESSYYVYYDANTGTGKMPISTIPVDSASELRNNTFEKTGYAFAGWSTTKDGDVVYENQEEVLNIADKGTNITLYAKWTPHKYTVTLNANGGVVNSNEIQVIYDETYGALPNPEKQHYDFKGWYNSKGDRIEENTVVKITENEALYAIWEASTYKISFYGCTNQDFTTANLTGVLEFQHGTPTTLDPNKYYHDEPGLDMIGWKFYNESGSEIDFNFGDAMPTHNIVVKAQWKYKSIDKMVIDNTNLEVDASYTYHRDYFDISEFSSYFNDSYTLTFTIRVYMKEINDGYQEFYLANSNNTKVGSKTNHSLSNDKDKAWTKEMVFAVDGSKCTDEMHMIYGAHGEGSDDWIRYKIEVSLTVTKK